MSTYEGAVAKLGDHIVSTLERIQEIQLDTLNALSSAASEVAPDAPDVPGPSPHEIAEANFALVERVLEAQRSYVFSVLDALSPLTTKVAGSTEQRAAKSSQ